MKYLKTYQLFESIILPKDELTIKDHFEGISIYEVKEGSSKVYHGGKIPIGDVDFLFREQGGVFATKAIAAALKWAMSGGMISSQIHRQENNNLSFSKSPFVQQGNVIPSMKITPRVYELDIKPGTRFINISPTFADDGKKGGLKGGREKYLPLGIEGMAHTSYMFALDGKIPKDFTGKPEIYFQFSGRSEVVVFNKECLRGFRVVPFAEVIRICGEIGGVYNKSDLIRKWYSKMKGLLIDLRGTPLMKILIDLKEGEVISDSDQIKEICDIKIYSNEIGHEGDDPEIEALIEKLGAVGCDSSLFKGSMSGFITILDVISYTAQIRCVDR